MVRLKAKTKTSIHQLENWLRTSAWSAWANLHALPRLDLWPFYQALSENRLPPKNPMNSDQFNCNSVANILVVNGKSPLFKTKPWLSWANPAGLTVKQVFAWRLMPPTYRICSMYGIFTGWWFQPLWKNMSSSVGMTTFPIYGKKTKNVPNHQPVYLQNSVIFRVNVGIFHTWSIWVREHEEQSRKPVSCRKAIWKHGGSMIHVNRYTLQKKAMFSWT